LELTDIKQVAHQFFIRVKGDVASLKDKVWELFGEVEVIKADGVDGEMAFLTSVLTEEEINEKISKLPNVLNMIRVRF